MCREGLVYGFYFFEESDCPGAPPKRWAKGSDETYGVPVATTGRLLGFSLGGSRQDAVVALRLSGVVGALERLTALRLPRVRSASVVSQAVLPRLYVVYDSCW